MLEAGFIVMLFVYVAFSVYMFVSVFENGAS